MNKFLIYNENHWEIFPLTLLNLSIPLSERQPCSNHKRTYFFNRVRKFRLSFNDKDQKQRKLLAVIVPITANEIIRLF